MDERMSDEQELAEATRVGLQILVATFPSEVIAAARQAATERAALTPMNDPAAEPWPPMVPAR